MANATINQQLARLVAAAGGLPVGIDAWSEPETLLERADALVINGGIDLDPSAYGADRHAETDPAEPERDAFELALARGALDRRLPVLGICRGMHVLNAVRGGTLLQHLPDVTDLEHYNRDAYSRPVHAVSLAEGSRVAHAFDGPSATVNSIHHQGVDRLGSGLRATARAPDGTIEAFEDDSGTVLGIQWHPEFLAAEFIEPNVDLFRLTPVREVAEAAS